MIERVLAVGSGRPVTLVVPGRDATVPEMRVFGSGVAGTRVFFESDAEVDELGVELRRLADEHEATRVVGVSRGAAAVLRTLAATPERFERVGLVLPYEPRLPPDLVTALARVGAPVLVLGQEADPTHPVGAARAVAAALPTARLEILPPGGLREAHADRVRALLTALLGVGPS